ncbi:cell envelope integrity protein TolA [Thiomicrorhabdus sp. Kp2]|uniref:cell envelope integrity protein TolA n=1 Tax=Thiomicrorhabdus sp. Kp2 TaxID=1123518 RepID=UPI0004274D3C|nr:cell envelope integrity protein TolA [Thiomicrorhabdus sp. Kp2]
MLKFIVKHPISIFLALVLHISLVTAFSVQWLDEPEKIKISSEGEESVEIKQVATLEPMKTFTVDSSQVQAQLEKIKAEQEAKRQEQKNLQAKTQEERERLKELKKKQETEKAKADKAKQLAEEQKRKAEAERKKTEEAKRLAQIEKKKADAERKKAEQAKQAAIEAEQKSKEAKQKTALAEKQRLEEEKKKKALEKELARKAEENKALEKAAIEAKREKEQQEAAAALQRQLDQEAAEQREAQKRKQMLSLRETYISSITAKVKDNWRTPARISPEAQCDLKITQSPTGSITSVKVLNCNKFASKQFKEAAEKAVYRAEPLPAPPVKELFEREITFEFKP